MKSIGGGHKLLEGSPLKAGGLKSTIDSLLIGISQILDYKMRIALGKPLPPDAAFYDEDMQDKLLKYAQPIVQSYQVTNQLNCTSISDIMVALRDGTITISEAKELISLYKDIISTKELESTTEKINGLLASFTEDKTEDIKT